MLENFFKLKENGTNVKTEFMAGLTTFMTMAYIIFVNPSILADAGMPFEGVFIATIMGAVLGTLCMAFITNYPFALASGMGLNAFFAYTLVGQMGLSWQVALGLVLLEGILFIIISIFPIREMIVNSIPMSIKTGISAGIGLFIAYLGLKNAGIIVDDPATFLAMGDILSGPALIALLGLIITGILHARKVRGAILYGIIISTILGWFNGVTPPLNGIVALPSMKDWSTVLFKLDLRGALQIGTITAMISLLFVDIFDTAGTLVGVAQHADYLDEKGNLPKAGGALLADAIGTTGGALFGTSTVTTYVESAAGVGAGGRTGLTGVFVSLFFLLALFFRPIVGLVPSAATAPALIIVGTMMITNITKLDWNDFTEVLPAFVTMIFMPFTTSIANGIALGFIVYPLVKLFTGKGKEVHWLVYTLAALFVFYFIFI
ncbi:MAG TPA: NCS2 family permease [Halanaerobiaceae bacterium]|jgi:AGZA family xanthine/uracil permease-like MFS transporter|nr:NCS2 family permease [Bacillota bacterium]HHU92430.1 NCS2 family permease [Halanaerobiaceae bacterium]HOA40552.1 NCS2 family permease [Halanaerobiales bacterium]HPZ62722.1 NCS2 family permease [Halanaerobiales bacterium]HQD04067.1 NCS2 family permease [Halanaerobiales bacterium]